MCSCATHSTRDALRWKNSNGIYIPLVFFRPGYAYQADAHIRVDVLHERLRHRTKAWIELYGILFAAPALYHAGADLQYPLRRLVLCGCRGLRVARMVCHCVGYQSRAHWHFTAADDRHRENNSSLALFILRL